MPPSHTLIGSAVCVQRTLNYSSPEQPFQRGRLPQRAHARMRGAEQQQRQSRPATLAAPSFRMHANAWMSAEAQPEPRNSTHGSR